MASSGIGRADAPIGMFDSGVGGLTVLRQVRRRLPTEAVVYLGDTARVPYGTKSADSVLRYAERAVEHLARLHVKLVVVACNTASALALAELRTRFDPLPIVGVIEPGARAAVAVRAGGRHLVLATESTVAHGAYTRAIRDLDSSAEVEELACSVMVSLAEEGWTGGEAAEAVLRTYLTPVLTRADAEPPDSVLLGCTHFPVLAPAIRAITGPGPAIVDSAATTAEAVRGILTGADVLRDTRKPGSLKLLATDGATRFARVGARFLGEAFQPSDVEIVDL